MPEVNVIVVVVRTTREYIFIYIHIYVLDKKIKINIFQLHSSSINIALIGFAFFDVLLKENRVRISISK